MRRLKELGERIRLAWDIIKGRDSGLVDFTRREVEFLRNGDEMDQSFAQDAVDLVRVFSTQHHSGSTASLIIGLLNDLLTYTPIRPLTGEDDEWVDLDYGTSQNIRCFHVFRDQDGRAYDSDAVVFRYPDGTEVIGNGSSQYIDFPYWPKRIVLDVTEDMDPVELMRLAEEVWTRAMVEREEGDENA